MQSKNYTKTTAMEEWEKWLRSQPCVLTGQVCENLHHPAGAMTRRFRRPIGKWYQLPCTVESHAQLAKLTSIAQSEFFLALCEEYIEKFYALPFDTETLVGILTWSKTERKR